LRARKTSSWLRRSKGSAFLTRGLEQEMLAQRNRAHTERRVAGVLKHERPETFRLVEAGLQQEAMFLSVRERRQICRDVRPLALRRFQQHRAGFILLSTSRVYAIAPLVAAHVGPVSVVDGAGDRD